MLKPFYKSSLSEVKRFKTNAENVTIIKATKSLKSNQNVGLSSSNFMREKVKKELKKELKRKVCLG